MGQYKKMWNIEFVPWYEIEKRNREKELNKKLKKSEFVSTSKCISTTTILYSYPVKFVNIDNKK